MAEQQTSQTPAPAGSGDGTPASSAPAPASSPASNPAERPPNVPEKFWDPERGAIRIDALLTSYGELEKHLGGVHAKVRDEVLSELHRGRPETPDAYALTLADGQTLPDGLVLLHEKPPETFTPEEGKTYFLLDQADPLLGWWRKAAYDAGLSQDKFMSGVLAFAEHMGQRAPTKAEEAERVKAELAKLGENGPARAAAVEGLLVQTLGRDKAKALTDSVRDAGALTALEDLMKRVNGAAFAPDGDGATKPAPAGLDELRGLLAEAEALPKSDPRRATLEQQYYEGLHRLFPEK